MNPITKAFIDFCAAKPPEETYVFADIDDCPMAQFGKTRYLGKYIYGRINDFVVSSQVGESIHVVLDCSLNDCHPLVNGERTFGALTERLKKIYEN